MGKTIFITGAGTGLGRGAVIGLAKKGHRDCDYRADFSKNRPSAGST
jgi:NAD(P)-dependent dehydrogenase (short-subunit alcohol dehydrogenase family)